MAGAKQFTVYTKFAVNNKMSGPMIGIAKGIDKFHQKTKAAQDTLKSMAKDVMAVGKFALGIGAAAVAAGAGAFALAKNSADAADEIMNLSASLGISTDALQQYRYLALQSGMTTEDMDTALTKMTVNLGKNFNEVDAALYQIGLSAQGLKDAGPEQALEYLSTGFAGTADDATKAAVAVSLFGKSKVKFVNMLKGGPKAVAEGRKQSDTSGYTMKNGMLKNANDTASAMDRFGATMVGVGNRLSSGMMPQLTGIIDRLSLGLQPGGEYAGFVTMISNGLGGLAGFGEKALGWFSNLAPAIQRAYKQAKPFLDSV